MKPYLLLLLLSSGLPLHAQQPRPEAASDPAAAFHRTHVGQVLFSAAPIPATAYASAAYLGFTTYALTPQSNLYLTAFMGTSLPNVLEHLAPEAQRTDFMKRGSYQYCFYVDEQLVYTAYLEPEPQYLAERDVSTVLHQPLLDARAARDKNSLWNRFLANGGKKALPAGHHLLRLVIRPYIQSPLLKVGPTLAAGQVALDITAPAALVKRPR